MARTPCLAEGRCEEVQGLERDVQGGDGQQLRSEIKSSQITVGTGKSCGRFGTEKQVPAHIFKR